MKIINFKSGLGNQLFFYLMSQYLKEKYPNEHIYGYYNSKFLSKHNGLELDYAFDVSLPAETTWSKIVAVMARIACRFIKGIKVSDTAYCESGIYFDGYWQDKKYFLDNINKIQFKVREIGNTNEKLLKRIENEYSVSVHVRRGDYLAPEHINQYGGICTPDYYRKAINIFVNKFPEVSFFVFSNDIRWVKKNLVIPNSTYVNNNSGINSYMDMLLMSRCKANIIANSSFSYWGAMLNIHKEQLVVYPGKWFNTHTPDIFPNKWIAL